MAGHVQATKVGGSYVNVPLWGQPPWNASKVGTAWQHSSLLLFDTRRPSHLLRLPSARTQRGGPFQISIASRVIHLYMISIIHVLVAPEKHHPSQPGARSLEGVTLTQTVPPPPRLPVQRLPPEWASGFPALISLDLAYQGVTGSVPDAWQRRGAFPALQTL